MARRRKLTAKTFHKPFDETMNADRAALEGPMTVTHGKNEISDLESSQDGT